ncbi:2-oxoglutarate dehydrogenase complex dihydrolipoyllysine-residue succinyltransferase [Sulfitobacter sp. KE29]|uniref:2-oxoglutarate dehydrogenase complex dihydrolipoyllysine-residue succinyltransferase n=1 Tax=unclassified Sulfitobacter TaxID=196795 RepID=UPI0007C337C9|nr:MULTISPECIES: 2-oxoglutarate dehydrogenase complex dihydrolipoyllysine-residue succinyltransferase [unclassified Sulfitobacter]KZY53422.1 dihydrolipoamide succinyltransferase [Sulfitobacter sp. HI0054]MBO9439084.1 2-oxoglutarate dehydrogenase complex dihydrolipoyllysine-residue succinyltransferase [Sulfitobacter sp. R18_2]MDF3418971.1 2-oxoglutarate dehydrogenase complex dihydrolipoyllysine-residue succinyltransferase [Sulfitobacter sp. Ks38]MDF3426453.1 2-oxoglutarate dehydrogenase complex 
MTSEVRVPTLGESVTEATVATWFKKPGDTVAVDEMLCELETDKVTVEVPSPVAGTLSEIVAQEGDTVGVDALLANVSEGDSGSAAAPKAKEAAEDSGAASQSDRGGDAPKAIDAGATEVAAREGQSIDVLVPTLGESVTEATVSTWFKKVGDKVEADEMLCELETDKVSVEVPAPAAGVLAEIFAEEGSTVEASATLAALTTGAGAAAPKGEDAQSGAGAAPETKPADGKDVEDAPSAKKAMAEAGISRDQVTASGRDGRVMKEDVAKAVAAGASAPKAEAKPTAPRAASAPDDAAREERVKMTRLKQTMARRLKEAQNTAAILTTFNEVDMTEVMALRNAYKADFEKKHGVRMGFMSFFTKACCHALKEIPEVNAEIDGTDVIYKNYVHIGVAAGTPTGLVVPVIKDADAMSFAEIEKAVNAMGKKARDGKLTMADMTGGTFTISNGGVYGSLMTAPILNPPQSGILGMAKIQDRPMAINGEVVIRPMMYISLSYDHRLIDGKGAVTFLVRVKEMLEDPRRLLMDL